MNRKTYASFLALALLALIFLAGCSSSSGPPIVAVAGATSAPTATVTTTYGAPLTATVTANGTPVGTVAVTFTAPSSGPSGTFANGTNTETDMTVSGVATSTAFTANGTAGSFNVVASTLPAAAGNIGLTNTGGVYSYYLSGTELINDGPNYYALAGSVVIDGNGNTVANGNIPGNTTVAGEQDYNDGFGLTSPQPSGDTIAPNAQGSPALVVDATGQGTLTLATNNGALGVGGVETLGVQFVNANHALIIQFDGSATSSGSLDLQSLPNAVSGNYAFTLQGQDFSFNSLVLGGVISVSSGAITGIYDENDAGFVVTGTAFPVAAVGPPVVAGVTASSPDAFGRGTITGTDITDSDDNAFATAINYYVVGSEALRIIDVDEQDSGAGSVFGQGGAAFNNGSLGAACATMANANQTCGVFAVGSNSNPFGFPYSAVGQIAAIPDANDATGGTFTGVADDNEEGSTAAAASIAGNYSVSSTVNGYSSLGIANGDLQDVTTLGIYMTDPALNLNDPNNTAGGGGALVAEMDLLVGTGVLAPQTDTAVADFAGTYGFGFQDFLFCEGCEFDFVGQGSFTGGVLAGDGLINDPGNLFGGGDVQYTVAEEGTATPDPDNLGRYTMPSDFQLDGTDVGGPFLTIYQASAGQLFWMDLDGGDVLLGSVQQQGVLPPFAGAVKKATPKAKLKRK